MPIASFGNATIDHEIVEQVIVTGAFPNLWMHDDGAIETDHLVGGGSPRGDIQLVVSCDHVTPPGLLDIAFQLDTEGTVIPKAVKSAVNFA